MTHDDDQIRIKFETKSKKIVFDLNSNMTIEELKKKLERDWIGRAPAEQKLTFQGRYLLSGTLRDNYLGDNSVIQLNLDSENENLKKFRLHFLRSPQPLLMDYNENMTIREVKEKICQLSGFSCEKQTLVGNCRVLFDDSASLFMYHILPGDSIYLVAKD